MRAAGSNSNERRQGSFMRTTDNASTRAPQAKADDFRTPDLLWTFMISRRNNFDFIRFRCGCDGLVRALL